MHDPTGLRASRPAIALTGINLSLGRGATRVHILKDVNLHIGSGEAVGLVGPSGVEARTRNRSRRLTRRREGPF